MSDRTTTNTGIKPTVVISDSIIKNRPGNVGNKLSMSDDSLWCSEKSKFLRSNKIMERNGTAELATLLSSAR